MKQLVALFIMLCFLGVKTQAQPSTTDLALDEILPLNKLLELATQNLTALNSLNASQDIYKQESAITRKKWLQHVALTAGVNYGNGIVSDQLTNGNTDNRFTYLSRQNITYNLGLNIRLPFTEVVSRKHEIKIKELEIERLEGLKTEKKELIRQEIIRYYKDLKSYLKSMVLQTEVVQANAAAMEIAENYFKAGKLSMEQYRMAVDSHYTSKLEFEKSKNEAWYCVKILNELVGQSIMR